MRRFLLHVLSQLVRGPLLPARFFVNHPHPVTMLVWPAAMILAGAGMLFESKNTRLGDVPWYVWLFYSVGIITFFVLLLKQVWWYFGATNVFFLGGSYLLHKTKKSRAAGR